jgi:hypothetical protein
VRGGGGKGPLVFKSRTHLKTVIYGRVVFLCSSSEEYFSLKSDIVQAFTRLHIGAPVFIAVYIFILGRPAPISPLYSCTHWLRPCNSLPPLPRHFVSYTMTILVSQDRRHLFVTPCLHPLSVIAPSTVSCRGFEIKFSCLRVRRSN